MITKYIKNTQELKILDLFLRNPERKFLLTEIARQGKINYVSVQKSIPILKKRKLIRISGRAGSFNFYQLNEMNDFNQAILFIK